MSLPACIRDTSTRVWMSTKLRMIKIYRSRSSIQVISNPAIRNRIPIRVISCPTMNPNRVINRWYLTTHKTLDRDRFNNRWSIKLISNPIMDQDRWSIQVVLNQTMKQIKWSIQPITYPTMDRIMWYIIPYPTMERIKWSIQPITYPTTYMNQTESSIQVISHPKTEINLLIIFYE
jgi:hypothetical protein